MFAAKRICRLFCLALCLAGVGTASPGQAETLKVCYDQWPPMTIFPTEEAPERGVSYSKGPPPAGRLLLGDVALGSHQRALAEGLRQSDVGRFEGREAFA